MNLKELLEIKDKTLPQMALRSNLFEDVNSIYEKQVLVCGDTGCRSSHSEVIEKEIREAISKAGKEKSIDVVRVGCFGLCEAGPIAIVYPGGKFYAYLKEGDGTRIAEEDLLGGKTVEELIYKETLTDDVLKSIYEIAPLILFSKPSIPYFFIKSSGSKPASSSMILGLQDLARNISIALEVAFIPALSLS